MPSKSPINVLLLDGSNLIWSPIIGAILTQTIITSDILPERLNRLVIKTAGIYSDTPDEADELEECVQYGQPIGSHIVSAAKEEGVDLSEHRSTHIDPHTQIKTSNSDLIVVCNDRPVCEFLHQMRREHAFEIPILFFDCEPPRNSLIRLSQAHIALFVEWMWDQAPNLLNQIDMLLPLDR